jgi:hypothetical protein
VKALQERDVESRLPVAAAISARRWQPGGSRKGNCGLQSDLQAITQFEQPGGGAKSLRS